MLSLSVQEEDHPGKMTQASVRLYVCVHTRRKLHTHMWLNRALAFFGGLFFAVNAGLYLHGSLWALCLLALACALLILWAEVWNERRRPVADGEVRGTPKAAPPTRWPDSSQSHFESCSSFSPTSSCALWCHHVVSRLMPHSQHTSILPRGNLPPPQANYTTTHGQSLTFNTET